MMMAGEFELVIERSAAKSGANVMITTFADVDHFSQKTRFLANHF
jgi:hypothetical protein